MSKVWAYDSRPCKEEALWQKKKCFTPLSWLDLLSKCWSTLTCSWSAVCKAETQNFSEALQVQRTSKRTKRWGPANRLIEQSAPAWPGYPEMRSACTFFPFEAHVFSGGCYLLVHSATKRMEGNSFLTFAEHWEDLHIHLHLCQHL